MIFMKNYKTRLLKLLQNLINQHDHKYLIIQHAVTHADWLWQILDRKKICQELKEEKNKMQNCYKNFDQCCWDDFWLQNQNEEQEQQDSHCSSQQNSQDFWWWESHDIQPLPRQDLNRSKLSLFTNEHDYHKKNNLCFRCSLSDHSARDCKSSFNLN